MTPASDEKRDDPDQCGADPRLPSEATVMRYATGYLAQRSASSEHLRQVLERRISKRLGNAESRDGIRAALTDLIGNVVDRLLGAGVLDDAAYAASKARGLARKGLPARRIRHELERRGVPWAESLLPEQFDEEEQARRYAVRKRLGPYRAVERPSDPERDVQRLVRAGFTASVAKAALQVDKSDANDP
jgi:regulatory protein